MRVVLFDVRQSEPMRQALAIRLRVFVDEQGVPLAEEVDDHDRTDLGAVHALAFDGDEAVGTARFFECQPGWVQIGRMAVNAQHRGRGIGSTLLTALLAEARKRGYASARLLAQVPAIPLYRRAGFRVCGDPFHDCGIEHRPMEALLG